MRYYIILLIILVSSFPLFQCVVQRPKGIHLDVEPHVLGEEWENNKNQIMNEFLDLLDKVVVRLNGTDLLFTVDWYDENDVIRNGQTLNFMEEIVKRVDRVAIMDYRDWAEGERNLPTHTSANGRDDNMIRLATDEINFASQVGKKAVVIGETLEIDPSFITFYEEDVAYMEGELMKVATTFNGSSGYDGLAIHMAASWTEKNPPPFTRTCFNARDVFHWNPNTISVTSTRAALLQHCATHGVRTLYMNSFELLQTDPYALEMLLEESYALGISVEFLAGDPNWSYEMYHSHALGFIDNSISFINNLPSPVAPASGPCEPTGDSTTGSQSTGVTTSTHTGSATTGTETTGTQTGSVTTGTQTGSATTAQTVSVTTGAQSGSVTTGTETTGTQTGSSTTGAQTGSSTTSTETGSVTTGTQTGHPTTDFVGEAASLLSIINIPLFILCIIFSFIQI